MPPPNSLAPMSLISYDEVRPWARSIKNRTSLRDQPGVMPPWYIEKDIGIQKFKDDWSLSDTEIATIARWADNGAPRGNPADCPSRRRSSMSTSGSSASRTWSSRQRRSRSKAKRPIGGGSLGQVDSGLTEDRYVSAIEYKEVNDLPRGVKSDTVGGLFVVHHSAMAVFGARPQRRSKRNASLAGARSRSQRRRVRRAGGAADESRLQGDVPVDARACKRHRHQRADRHRLPFPSRGIRADEEDGAALLWQRPGSRYPRDGGQPARRRLLHVAEER